MMIMTGMMIMMVAITCQDDSGNDSGSQGCFVISINDFTIV